jgi:hypothetical protein
MKKLVFISILAVFGVLSCTIKDNEIIDLINQMKKQNDDLLLQLGSVKKTTDSALVAVSRLNLNQSTTDTKIEILRLDLQKVLTQIASLNLQITNNTSNVTELKAKVDALQLKCADLVTQIELLSDNLNKVEPSYLSNYLPQSGLVAWYPFNGNANDESGNGNNGTVNGATLISDRLNNNNKAYTFDGNDFIQSSFKGVLGGNKRTLSFWAKTSSSKITDGMAAVSYGPNGVGSRFDGFFNFYEIGVTANIGGAAITYKSPSRVNDNKWHHYIFMIDNINPMLSSIKVFQDGIILNFILSAYNNQQIPVNTLGGAPLVIGKCSDVGKPAYFFGDLDDIAIWNRALTTEEISKIYKGEKF